MMLISQQKSNLDKLHCFGIERNIQLKLNKKKRFSSEIDRLFFCVKDGIKVASLLQEVGLYSPDTAVRSTSEGTLSKIFFFQNIYLAILWTEDSQNSISEEPPTGINFSARANWQQTKASPFGIGLSRRQKKDNKLNFDLDLINSLIVDKNIYYFEQNQKNIIEPFVFFLPDRLAFRKILSLDSARTRKFIDHPLGVKKITKIKITVQKGKRRDSDAINFLKRHDYMLIERGDEPSLELIFDQEIKGKVIDIRPMLPIILKY